MATERLSMRKLREILRQKWPLARSHRQVAAWHEHIGDPTLADAICDRLLYNSHRLILKGPSQRKEGKLESC